MFDVVSPLSKHRANREEQVYLVSIKQRSLFAAVLAGTKGRTRHRGEGEEQGANISSPLNEVLRSR